MRDLYDELQPTAPQPGGGDLYDELAPAAQTVGAGEMFMRGAKRQLGNAGTYFGRALAAPAAVIDYAGQAMGRDPRLFDAVFRLVGGEDARQLAESGAMAPGERPASLPAEIAGGAGEFVGMLPDLLFGMKGTRTAAPILEKGAQAAFEAARPIVGRVLPDATRGATTMFPAAARSATQQYGDLVDQGVDPAQAAAAATVQGAGLMAMGAAPAAMPGNIATRVGTGAGFNVASGMGMREAQNAILPGSMQQPVADPAAMTLDAILGAAFGAMGPRRAGPPVRVDSAPVYDRWDAFPIETPEQAAARTAPPEEAQPMSRNPEQAAQQVMARLFQTGEGAPQAPEDFTLVPRAADRQAQRMSQPAEPPLEGQYRAPEMDTEGAPRVERGDIADVVAERIRREEAFRMAEARKQRAQGDRMAAEQQGVAPEEFEAQPDYRAGAANTRRPATATLVMLDAKRGRDGKLAGGVPIEPLGPVIVKDAKGNDVPGMRVRTPDGNEIDVPMSRLSTVDQPVNPRMAQDTAANVREMGRGVDPKTGKLMGIDGVEERGDAGIPDYSADVTGTQSFVPFDPEGRDAGAVTGDVERPAPTPRALRAPREGQTIDQATMPTVPGNVRPAVAPNNRLTPPTRAEGALPAPDAESPTGAPTGRMVVDSEGTARPERQTYEAEQAAREQAARDAEVQRYSRDELGNTARGVGRTDTAPPPPESRGVILRPGGEEPPQGPPERDPWDAPAPPPERPAGDVTRAQAEGMAEPLREMAGQAGWAEKAGTLIREGGGIGEGKVIGRTDEWVARFAWFKAMRDELKGKAGLSNPKEIAAAVEKAIRGEKLNKREAATVNWMLDELERMGRVWENEPVDPFALDADLRAEGLRAETPEDAELAALTARAAELDADAVERAAIQFENDPDAFRARMQEIVDADQVRGGEGGEGGPAVREPAEGEPADPAGGRGGGDADGVQAPRADGERPADDEGGADPAEAFSLERPTPDELRRRDEAKRRADAEEAARRAAPDSDDFTLTGSDRPADQAAARGQEELFGAAEQARDAVNDPKGGTLFANPLGPVMAQLGKMLGFDSGHLGRALDDVKGMWARRSEKGQNPVAHAFRTVVFSIDGQMRSLERIYFDNATDNPISKIRRMLNADPGQGTGVGRTFGEAVNLESIAYRNRLAKALEPFADKFGDDKATAQAKKGQREQITRLLQNRSQINPNTAVGKAAAEIAKALDDIVAYAQKAGVPITKLKDYFPRVLDDMAVMADPKGFEAAATQAYMRAGLSRAEAQQAAQAWTRQTVLGGAGVVENPFLDFANSIPKADYAKHRMLSKAADELLRKYLVQDPADVLETYIHKVVRRAEWQRRFGDQVDSKGKVTNAYQELRAEIEKKAGAKAVGYVDGLVLASVGQLPGPTGRAYAGLQNLVSWQRSLTVIEFLRHATLTSLSEPLLTGARTGNPADAFKGYVYALHDVARRAANATLGPNIAKAMTNATTEQARAIAEMVGAVENHLAASAAHVLHADGNIDSSRLAGKLATRATMLSGLRQWTDATRVASVRVGMEFIRHMGDAAVNGDKIAQRAMRELGVPDAQQQAFAQWLAGTGGNLQGAVGKGGDMAEMYRTAIGRFADQVIMQPKNADKPFYANHPIGSVAYNLTGYLYAFQQNVLNRTGRMMRDAFDGKNGLGAVDRVRLLAPVMSLAMLPIMQAALVPVRDWIKGTDEEKRKKKYTETSKFDLPFVGQVDTGVPQWIMEAGSRSGLLGVADPLVNLMTSARYEKRPSSLLIGPFGGSVENLFTETFARNSENTNTGERQWSKAFYNAVVDPAVTTFATAYLPGPAAVAVSQGMAMERTRSAFQTATAGEKAPTDPTERRLYNRMRDTPERRQERRMRALEDDE